MSKWLRKLWPPGVRLQLTIVYSAGFSVIALLGLLLAALAINLVTLDRFDTQLDLRVDRIVHQIDEVNGILVVHDSGNGIVLTPAVGVAGGGVHVPGDDRLYVRIMDITGKTLYQTDRFAAVQPTPADIFAALRQSKPRDQARIPATNTTIRMVTVAIVPDKGSSPTPLPAAGEGPIVPKTFGIIQVGAPLSQRELAFAQVLPFLPYIGLILVALSVVSGFGMASRVFRPIFRLTSAARDIAAGNLSRRVAVPISRDDVHDLAVSFNEMATRVEATFNQQRRFVADASHELRTPVAAIRSLTDVALIQQDAAAARRALEAVNAESERLGKLISDLLTLARFDDGQLVVDRDPVRLDLLMLDAVASMEPLAEERGLRIALGEVLPATVVGDAARIIQVMLSLLDNALVYTPAGGTITVTVTTKGRAAALSIQDTGIGIDSADLPHIFDRFYRADAARTRNAGGSGLGLSLAGDLVRAQGGTIQVISAKGSGSLFTVLLPKRAVKAPVIHAGDETARRRRDP